MRHSGTALIDPADVFQKIALSPGMRVADMGCGRTGHFVFSSARVVGDKGIVYAVDILKEVLENLKSLTKSEGYQNVQTIWSDIETYGKTPVPSESLDVCFFVNVFFQLNNKETAIKEAGRLLKKDGCLVIVDWAKNLGTLGPAPERMTSPAKIIDMAQAEKFKLFDKNLAGDYHYVLIFKK